MENSQKVGPKIRFRPKMSAEKELQGENGAFDIETAGFRGTSASVQPENDQKVENAKENSGCVLRTYTNFGWSKNGPKCGL